MNKPITEEILSNFILDYNGDLFRINKTGGLKPINTPTKKGYVYVQVDNKDYLAHRIVWALANGRQDPGEYQVDHIDGDKENNHPSNLRLASNRQNCANRLAKGIKLDKRTGSYEAKIRIDGNYVHLGCFKDEEDALAAYQKAHKEAHGAFSPY